MNDAETAERFMYLVVTKPDEYMWRLFAVTDMLMFEKINGRMPTLEEVKKIVDAREPKKTPGSE
jgi:hypothetical protein